MAPSAISLLLIRRVSLFYIKPKSRRLFQPLLSQSISTSAQNKPELGSDHDHKPSSLSSRLSFVFDQIDAIEKRHSEQDETLERIRAWRQSKQSHQQTPSIQQDSEPVHGQSAGSNEESNAAEMTPVNSAPLGKENNVVELVHPWPEWMELMERLVQQNYFDHRRQVDDEMEKSLGIDVSTVTDFGIGEENVGIALFQDFKAVQNAFINFGKDRFDIIRSLSRNDIQILVGYGCPATDRKVVFSGKLLRKRVHLDEGDVCSSCSLRNSCEKAFLLTNKEDEARTIDIMRILLTYGFDPLNGTEANKALLKKKSVKTVVRKMLHEIVKLSAVPIDPNLTPPIIKKAPPKVKQPPPTPKRRVGRDDVEMKKGDWLCPKCDFMNFAKNTVCLQCDAKRPKRQLLPGEWECPECNFLNYRRNMACFHCDCKRPPDEFMENKTQETQRFTGAQGEKIVKREDISNAWNFDFDDDESDGAEVAAFEYADSTRKNENFSREGLLRDPEDEFGNLPLAAQENSDFGRSRRPGAGFDDSGRSRRPGAGFDDFDDEDDIDSYEIDETGGRDAPKDRSSFAADEFSEDEQFPESKGGFNEHRGGNSRLYNNRNKHGTSKKSFSGDDEFGFSLDDEVSASPKWKSSHVASTKRGPPLRKLSFGSDDDSDMEDDSPRSSSRRGERNNGSRGGFKGKRSSYSASESDNDIDDQSYKRSSFSSNRSRGGGRGGLTRGGRRGFDDDFTNDNNYNRSSGSGNRSRGRRGGESRGFGGRTSGRRGGFESDDDDDYRGASSSGNRSRGSREDSRGFGGRIGSSRRGSGGFEDEFDRKSSRGRGSGGSRGGSNRRGSSNRHESDDRNRDNEDCRNSRRVIER